MALENKGEAMSQWDTWIGRRMEQQDLLTPASLARFRATIDSDETGDAAPQAIHWCLCLPDAPTAALAPDGHPQRNNEATGILPPLALPRRMWAASTVEFLHPIRAGDRIVRRSILAAVTEKSGHSGQLVFVDVDHDTHAGEQLAVHERQTIVYRDAATAKATKSAPSPTPVAPALDQWDWHRSITPSPALLMRYSALTFNSHRIHYDAPYAVGEEGYRGLVVHGPLIATLSLDLAARALGGNALRHFAMRAQAPAFVDEVLHLVGKNRDGAITLAALGSDGRVVMTADAQI